jgi:hypothetical protein
MSPPPLPHEEISRRARELWEKQGRPQGRDQDIWFEAERSLLREAQPSAQPTAPDATIAPASPAIYPQKPLGTQATATAKIPPLRASKNVRRDF